MAGTHGDRGPTIRDVAQRAGVSKSLVSLVLRDAPHVSPERRELVQRAMAELGYRPNRSARSLSTHRSDVVGVLINDLANPWFVDLLAGLTASLHGAGLGTVLADSGTDVRVGRRSVETLVDQGIDGLVVVGQTVEEEAVREAAQLVPVVVAGTREPELEYGDIVVDDDLVGGCLATRHLLDLGHRRIAHLSGPGLVGELRAGGFDQTMREAGLEGLVLPGGANEDSAYPVARQLLARRDRPTAVFAFNDLSAVATLSAADELDLDVPGDVSVVGYDDTSLARLRRISLTSVDNGSLAVGVQAGRYLIDRLDNPRLAHRLHLVEARLHIRTSSGPPPS